MLRHQVAVDNTRIVWHEADVSLGSASQTLEKPSEELSRQGIEVFQLQTDNGQKRVVHRNDEDNVIAEHHEHHLISCVHNTVRSYFYLVLDAILVTLLETRSIVFIGKMVRRGFGTLCQISLCQNTSNKLELRQRESHPKLDAQSTREVLYFEFLSPAV